MKVTEHEMRGLLAGKCLPGDIRVNEDLPAYLVRKFDALRRDVKMLSDTCDNWRKRAEAAEQKLDAAANSYEWSNEQCIEFLTVAFRHAEISGDIEMDDIRLGVKMANQFLADENKGGSDD